MTKVFVVLTAVLSIAASCLFISAAAQWDNWRELGQSMQTERDAAVVGRMHAESSAQAALAQKELTIAALQTDMQRAREEQTNLANQLTDKQQQLTQALNEAAAAKAELTGLRKSEEVARAEADALRTQNAMLNNQSRDLQTRTTSLSSDLLQFMTDKTILEEQVRNIQEKLLACEQRYTAAPGAGAPVADAGPAAPGATPTVAGVAGPIHGQVITVEGNYASISIGETSGVQPGMTFMVYRDGNYVGDLIVEKVRPKEAGGKLVTLVQSVQAGDRVVHGFRN
jgi:hypothetical protein